MTKTLTEQIVEIQNELDVLFADVVKSQKNLDIALDTLGMIAHLRKKFDKRYREFTSTVIKQMKELDK